MNQNETFGGKTASNMCTCVCEWVARSFLKSPGFRRANNRACLWDLSWMSGNPCPILDFTKLERGDRQGSRKIRGTGILNMSREYEL